MTIDDIKAAQAEIDRRKKRGREMRLERARAANLEVRRRYALQHQRTRNSREVEIDAELVKDIARRYENVSVFKRAHFNAYNFAESNNMLDELFPDRIVRKKWDHKIVKAEAKKYSTRRDFQTGAGGAYQYANRAGILDNICKHMYNGHLRRTKWTEPEVRATAEKCKSISEFLKFQSAYHAARRFGIFDEVTAHMSRKKDFSRTAGRRTKLSEQFVRAEAAKYNKRTELRKANVNAYHFAWRNGLLDELFPTTKRPV